MALNHSDKGSTTYTIVGSPTIVDGIASGFSSSDYLRTPILPLSSANSFEINLKISADNPSGTYTQIAGNDSTVAFQFRGGDGKLHAYVRDSNGQSALTYSYTQQSEISTIKLVYQNSVYSLYVNGNFIESLEKGLPTTDYPFALGTKMYGNSSGDGFLGSIDLNETYIKVNGQAWFGLCPVEVKHIDYGTSVGYTKVGSPTIVDGVASNFSASNYLAISNYSSLNNNDIEINLCFTILQKTGFKYGFILAAERPHDGIQVEYEDDPTTNECIRVRFGNGTTSSWYNTQIPIIYGKQYTLNIKFNNGTATVIGDVNGNSYTGQYTPSDTVVFGSLLKFGCRGDDEQINGSIDLNNTYIKVNGKLWFYRPCTNYLVKDDKLVFADSGLYLSGPNTYTKVGSPTIVDNVASGFSGSDYLITSQSCDITKLQDFIIKIKIDDQISWESGNRVLIDTNPQKFKITLYKNTSEQIFVNIWANGTSTNLTQITPSDWFYLKTSVNNGSIALYYSTDNTNYTPLGNAITPEFSGDTVFCFGINRFNSSQFFPGSIDLNETYIKADGSLWFYGKNYASQNIAPVPSGYTFGNTTTSAIGWVNIQTQAFTAAPSGATLGKDEVSEES